MAKNSNYKLINGASGDGVRESHFRGDFSLEDSPSYEVSSRTNIIETIVHIYHIRILVILIVFFILLHSLISLLHLKIDFRIPQYVDQGLSCSQ